MKEKVKSLGQYFTPEDVASFMCSLIGKTEINNVLEPCAGEGVFLKALSNLNFSFNIDAYEIDSTLQNLSEIEIKNENFLSVNIDEKYDIIIGNPPYVRWKNISKEIREELKCSTYWEGKINGLSDLLYAFIYKSIDLLENNGELIFITPIFWTQTQHSHYLRKYMLSKGEIEFFINFNEMKIFKEVSSSIIIFKFIKRKTGAPVKVLNLWSKKKIDNNVLHKILNILQRLNGESYISEDIFEAYEYPQFTNGNPWKPLPPQIKPLLDKVEESCTLNSPSVTIFKNSSSRKYPISKLFEKRDLEDLELDESNFQKVRFADKNYYLLDSQPVTLFDKKEPKNISRYVRLGDIVEIGNGMVSGLDKAFKVQENGENFNSKEREKFIPVVKAADLKQFFNKKETNYIFVNDIKDVKDLKSNYPHIYGHLLQFKDKLEKRYNYGKDIPWWDWVFLRNKSLMENNEEKIFIPCKERFDKKNHFRFAYITGKIYATQDVTAMVKKREFKEDLKYILALLNSEIIFKWIKYKGLNRGGVSEFSERPLSNIPIRLINWENEEEIEIHDTLVKLVEEIINKRDDSENKQKIEKYVQKLYLNY